jgi:hypothetical protein
MPAAASVLQTDVPISITKLRCCGFVILGQNLGGQSNGLPLPFGAELQGKLAGGPIFSTFASSSL